MGRQEVTAGRQVDSRETEGQAGWAGILESRCTRAVPLTRGRTIVLCTVKLNLITMQQRKQQEMAQPYVFLHTARPTKVGLISAHVCVGAGVG